MSIRYRHTSPFYFDYHRLVRLKTELLRKKMAAGGDLLSLPQSSEFQNEDKEDDDVPQSLYVCNAKDAINIKMVFTANDLIPDQAQRSFKPDLVFQIFGDSETIFGYRNLSIDIYFLANSATCFVDLKHNAIANSTNGPVPDDIFQKLTPWLPEQYYTNKNQFRCRARNEDKSKKFGVIVDTFKAYNKTELTTYKYIITECSASEPGFAEFHSRFECLIVWYIDAASQIDVHDPNWMFLYVYEQRVQPHGRGYGYYPVGYCTVYKFFHFPDKVRTRISQLFILPACQRSGIGIKLLKAAYNMIYKLPNVIDIAVEDPCHAFTCMRDMLDCQLLMQLESFRFPNITAGFTKQMFDEANTQFKFNRRQCRHTYEILRMAYIFTRHDSNGYQRFYREIKKHVEGPYLRQREAVKRKRVIMNRRLCRDDAFIYQPADCTRDLSKNVDLYFQEIKISAHHLCRKIQMK